MLRIQPPADAELPLKVQLVSVGWHAKALDIQLPELPLNVQLVSVGLL
jgi:hypothetical protein